LEVAVKKNENKIKTAVKNMLVNDSPYTIKQKEEFYRIVDGYYAINMVRYASLLRVIYCMIFLPTHPLKLYNYVTK
jgi:hypothetical protein